MNSESKLISLINKDRTMVIRVPRDGAKGLIESGEWSHTTKSIWRRYKKGKSLTKDSRTIDQVFGI